MALKQEGDQRATFRVAVKPDSGIEASLSMAGRSWPAAVGDISPEGAFIKLARGDLPALRVDSHVYVDVTFEGKTTRLQGIVRSQRAGGYGIHFPERDRIGHPNPRERLGRISVQLQRGDLSQRLKVLKLPQ